MRIFMDKEINLNDLFSISSGIDEDGNSNSASSILVFQQTDEEPLLLHNILFSPPVEIYASGGAVVCVYDFTNSETSEFMNAARNCLKWLNTSSETGQSLFLQVIPLLLKGQAVLLFSNLIFCDFYKMKNGSQRLILAFDNNATSLIIPEEEEIEYDLIQTEIENEIKKQEQELDEEIYQLEQELKRLNEQISGFNYEFDLNQVVAEDEEENHERKNYRFTEEE